MIRAIVTDIEGTTSDIRFVHQVLFPYARERLGSLSAAMPTTPKLRLRWRHCVQRLRNPMPIMSCLLPRFIVLWMKIANRPR